MQMSLFVVIKFLSALLNWVFGKHCILCIHKGGLNMSCLRYENKNLKFFQPVTPLNFKNFLADGANKLNNIAMRWQHFS